MSTDTPVTLTALFQKSGTALRVYDLGRRLRLLSNDEFQYIEELKTPYPAPYLHHAYIALMLWNPGKPEENAVWFLRLPLDEQGFMIPAVRDDLLNRLLANVQSSVDGVPQEDSLKENPFSFKPSDEKMAAFHARAAKDAGQPASIHYEAVQSFINDPATDWSSLSLQGLADFVIRMSDTDDEAALVHVLDRLPEGFLAQLLSLLEHAAIGPSLTKRLNAMITDELNAPRSNPLKVATLLRAVSGSQSLKAVQQPVSEVLNCPVSQDIEVLSAIATRCETTLMEPEILLTYLERLASNSSGQQGFSRVLAELMFLPVHRVLIVQALRRPDNSPALKAATTEMFGASFLTLN